LEQNEEEKKEEENNVLSEKIKELKAKSEIIKKDIFSNKKNYEEETKEFFNLIFNNYNLGYEKKRKFFEIIGRCPSKSTIKRDSHFSQGLNLILDLKNNLERCLKFIGEKKNIFISFDSFAIKPDLFVFDNLLLGFTEEIKLEDVKKNFSIMESKIPANQLLVFSLFCNSDPNCNFVIHAVPINSSYTFDFLFYYLDKILNFFVEKKKKIIGISADGFSTHLNIMKNHFSNDSVDLNLGETISINLKKQKIQNDKMEKLQNTMYIDNILFFIDSRHLLRNILKNIFNSNKIIIFEGEPIYYQDILKIVNEKNLKKNNFLQNDNQNFNRIIYFFKKIDYFKEKNNIYLFFQFLCFIYCALILKSNFYQTMFYLFCAYFILETNLIYVKEEKDFNLKLNFFPNIEICQLRNIIKNMILLFNGDSFKEIEKNVTKYNEYSSENIFSFVRCSLYFFFIFKFNFFKKNRIIR
jgi:hypothetical protein